MNGFKKRTEEKKQSVLQSAFELMNKAVDIRHVTMDEIAQDADVAKATIFKYFTNKDNLIHEVFEFFLAQMIASAERIINENKPFEETLIRLAQSKIHFLNTINKQFYSTMMAYLTEKNERGLSIMMQQYIDENYRMMLDLFHHGRKEGKVDLKYSDEFLLLYFQATVEGISNPQIYEKIVPYTEEWTEMLIKGIAPKEQQ